MKPNIAYRPLVELLENRLQPGSLLANPGSGVPLLPENPMLVAPDAEASVPWMALSVPEQAEPRPAAQPVAEPRGRLDVAAPAQLLVESGTDTRFQRHDGDGNWDDGWDVALSRARNTAALAVAALPRLREPAPATPVASVPQSPIGVAIPASAAAIVGINSPTASVPTSPATHAVPVPLVPMGSGTVSTYAGYQTMSGVHAVPLVLANPSNHMGGRADNQATLNFLSYLGGTGPDSIKSVAVQNENGANFIYVAGSFTDSNGRTDAFAAKLTDGATAAVWAETLTVASPGPDTATGLALNGNSVYLAGSIADTAQTAQTDGLLARLDASTGAILATGVLPNASLAAVTTDSAGNVYAAGTIPDPLNASRQDISVAKVSGDLSSTAYNAFLRLKYLTGEDANTSVTSGSGLLVDGKGSLFYAASVSKVGDPSNATQPLYGWLVEFSGLPRRVKEFTAADPIGTPGPRGQGTAVAFDPVGNVVFTGSFNNDGGTPLGQDLFLGRVAPITTFNPVGQPLRDLLPVDAYTWYVDDRTPQHNRAGDWTGTGLVVLPDGSTIVTGAAYDPAAPNDPPLSMPTNGIDIHLTHFLASDNATPTAGLLDADPQNTFGGSGTDIGMALALDPTNPNNVYVVGSTDSIDLPTGPTVMEPAYGGRSPTGFVGQASVT